MLNSDVVPEVGDGCIAQSAGNCVEGIYSSVHISITLR